MNFQLFLLRVANARLERELARTHAEMHLTKLAVQTCTFTLRVARRRLESALSNISEE